MEQHQAYEQIINDLTSFSEKLDNIHYALVGNPLAKDGGLVQRVANLETGQEKLKGQVDIIEKGAIKIAVRTGVLWGACGIAVTAILAVVGLIIQVFKK